MTPVATFSGAASRCSASAAPACRRCARWSPAAPRSPPGTTTSARATARRRRGFHAGRSQSRRLERLRRAGSRARRAADPSRRRIGRSSAPKAAGVAIIGDIELFVRERAARAPGAPFVAITGTNGKSTTTALVAHILREAGRDVAMGGNIGVPILDLPPPDDARVHVVECSSFQIDLAPSLAPSVGALINITPDHLDRHGTLENYAAIKERLVANAATRWSASTTSHAAPSPRGSPRGAAQLRLTTLSAAPSQRADVWVEDRFIVTRAGGRQVDLAVAPALRGAHNGQNAAFAFAATRALGLEAASD